MTVHAVMPVVDVVPESAPFSEEQRAWLNGFLAAALGVIARTDTVDLPGLAAPALDAASGLVLATNDDAPWHDPSLAAEERMTGPPAGAAPDGGDGPAGQRSMRL